MWAFSEGYMNRKPPAPCSLPAGSPPRHSAAAGLSLQHKRHGLIPEKTWLTGLPTRRNWSLLRGKGLGYSACYCIHLKYYSVVFYPDYYK